MKIAVILMLLILSLGCVGEEEKEVTGTIPPPIITQAPEPAAITLSLSEQKQIFYEIVAEQDKCYEEYEITLDPEDLPEPECGKEATARVIEKYDITVEEEKELSRRGLVEQWPMPEAQKVQEVVTEAPQITQPPATTPPITVPPTTAPPKKVNIEIVSTYPHMSRIGYPTVVGEVENTGNQNAQYVKIVCTFYDEQGGIIGTAFSYTKLDILRPGKKSPFEVTMLGDTGFSSAKTQVQWSSTNSEPYDYYEILSHRGGISNIGYFQVVGEVENTGDRQRDYNKVIGTFYDSKGDVVATGFTYTDMDTLSPGMSSPFELNVLDEEIASKIESYSVQVQS